MKPLNPGNTPDAWEAQALQSFERGQVQRLEVVSPADGSDPLVRYMAPLTVKPECMQCHDHQDYSVGDIRGGLSVSFSAESLLQEAADAKRNLIWIHGGTWGLVCGLLLFGLSHVRRQMLSLRKAKRQLDALVQLRTAELHTLTKAVEYSPTSTVITDADGVIEYVNPKFSEVTGYATDEVLGRNPRFLQSGRTSNQTYEAMWQTITEGNIWRGELLNRKKNGELYWEHISISPIRDTEGAISHFVALKEDVTEHKAQADLIHYQANYDHLTGLPNRKLFYERVQQHIDHARHTDSAFALVFIDLDGFKAINDQFGHDAGDLLLKETARRITLSVPESDTVARLGGDEFTLILQHANAQDAIAKIVSSILQRLKEPFELGEHQGHIAASIGISRYPNDGGNVDELLKRADSAMYHVKHNGRENFRFYEELVQQEGE